MSTTGIVVAGAGMAGLCSALLLAREGHQVTLVERDAWSPTALSRDERRGVPQYLQPHAFIPRGRLELHEALPDVLDWLLENGASQVDLRPKLPGDPLPGDEQLAYLAVRRPMIEAALRRAVAAEHRIQVRTGRVTALETRGGAVTGVVVDGEAMETALVVDALGRRSVLSAGPRETSDCGVVYYSRYYRLRPGEDGYPDGPWLLSPRGDLGYLAYASFPGDNGAFAALLAVPPGVAEWKAFHDGDTFERAVARIPHLASWADPARVEPITEVMAMAGLRNVAPPSAPGPARYVAVGDAFSHTDPVLAHGLSFAVMHARTVASLVGEAALDEVGAAFHERSMPEARERFDFIAALDGQRLRMWLGGPVDLAPDGDYALFSMAAAGAVASVDADVFRAFVRRIGLLDRTGVLDGDATLQRRIAERFSELRSRPRPALGPTREEMADLVAGQAQAGSQPVISSGLREGGPA